MTPETPGSSAPRFLSVDDVLTLHAIAIEDQGGDPSIRDRSLLESAVATPAQQFGGQYLHADIPAMAAAYAFHICKNHPFLDGNKRAAAAAMIVFLSDNGWSFDATADEAEPIILQLAASELDKSTFTDWARKHMHEKPKMELREFFLKLNGDAFCKTFDRLLPESDGQNIGQTKQTLTEATDHIPALKVLIARNTFATEQRDQEARLVTAAVLFTFSAIYRIAEDMGYEW